MELSNEDKWDLILLAGGEELQKIIETLPHEPTDHNSHLQELDKHFKASKNYTLELEVSCSKQSAAKWVI